MQDDVANADSEYYSTLNYDLEKWYASQNDSDLDWKCRLYYMEFPPADGEIYCNATYDTLLCWPPSKAGTAAFLPCPAVINHVKYDATKNASKYCYLNGTYDTHTDYSQCKPLDSGFSGAIQDLNDAEALRLIHFIGYSISLIAVAVALCIFVNFKDLRCLRNTFHANLLATYFLLALFWIISAFMNVEHIQNHMAACVMMVLLYYFQGTNFFWMFVEGFYLYMLVVRTFTVDKVHFRVYIFFGWGLPAIVVTIWAIVKTKVTEPLDSLDIEYVNQSCPWLEGSLYDWIFNAPILLVLLVNMIFLGRIMWVLITKLRAATTAESQQYRKAAKALLVLIPLFGIPYVIFIIAPKHGIIAQIITYTRAISLSTQGFTVAVIYCFLNGEVRNTLRHHIDRWRATHHMEGAPRYSSRYRDGSPRSRTESIRLCSTLTTDSTLVNTKESCVSCLTAANPNHVGNGHSNAGNKAASSSSSGNSQSNYFCAHGTRENPV